MIELILWILLFYYHCISYPKEKAENNFLFIVSQMWITCIWIRQFKFVLRILKSNEKNWAHDIIFGLQLSNEM